MPISDSYPFETPAATRVVSAVRARGVGAIHDFVRTCLNSALRGSVPPGYVDEGVFAAELTAALAGRPSPMLVSQADLARWVDGLPRFVPTQVSTAHSAMRILRRLFDSSPERVADGDLSSEFALLLDGLIDRLDPTPPPIPNEVWWQDVMALTISAIKGL